jgi:hypothetical protein
VACYNIDRTHSGPEVDIVNPRTTQLSRFRTLAARDAQKGAVFPAIPNEKFVLVKQSQKADDDQESRDAAC